jgi:hypothetical protein
VVVVAMSRFSDGGSRFDGAKVTHLKQDDRDTVVPLNPT